jgi:hypothetical protein
MRDGAFDCMKEIDKERERPDGRRRPPAGESPTLHDDARPAGCHRLTHVAATWLTEFKRRCVA